MQQTDLHTECKQKPGGRTGDQDNGNPRISSWLNTGCCDRNRSELYAPARDRHDTILHVGLPDLPERHSGAASEIDFRSHLRTRDAGAVGILLSLLPVLIALVKIRKQNWISKNHGRWAADHGMWRVPFSTRGFRSFLSAFPHSTSGSGSGNYWSSGIR